MTDRPDSGSQSFDDSSFDGSDSLDNLPMLSEADETFIREALADLDHAPMPAAVAARLSQTILAESAARSEADSHDNVATLSSTSHKRGRWLVASTGVVAAAAIGFVVISSLNGPALPAGPGIDTAAMVPMSASGMHYSHDNLASEVKGQLAAWQADATSASASGSASHDEVAISPSADESTAPSASLSSSVGPSPSKVSASSTTSTTQDAQETARRTIEECLRNVVDRTPMHVDLAVFRGPTAGDDQRVAVVAVPDSDEQVDVYVVGVGCSGSDSQVRAHVRVPQN